MSKTSNILESLPGLWSFELLCPIQQCCACRQLPHYDTHAHGQELPD
jgi:hypothetical protein